MTLDSTLTTSDDTATTGAPTPATPAGSDAADRATAADTTTAPAARPATTPASAANSADTPTENLAEIAKRHLVMNFTPAAKYRDAELPIFVRGEHCSVFDENGTRFFDGLAGLFCVQLGYTHGAEVGDAVREQMAALPYQTTWSVAHPPAAKLAQKIASLAPVTSTASSSPPAAASRTRRRSSSPASTTSPAASPRGTSSSPAASPTTARASERCRSTA